MTCTKPTDSKKQHDLPCSDSQPPHEKDFLRIITGFSEEEQNTIWQILRTHPKGSGTTHWTIKKVDRAIWQLDLPSGYRLEYTVVDTDRVVLVLFIGNHDDAAAYLRGKK